MIGQYIQHYKVVAHLGEGGMGVVYKAVDNVLGREVALKMLHSAMIRQPQVLERFKKEAQVLARLLHPNIAVIYNFIEQEGQYFMVMEYVEGKNLDELAKTTAGLPHAAVVAIFLQALEGLHHAHKKGIFHRDIKPSNLILSPEGTVKLMDFGIARIAGEQRLTQVNRVIGTVEFMAPELIEGKEPSAASDIYAAGITMYELLSGRLPFESQSDYNLMQDIIKKKPISLLSQNPAVPPALAKIVMKALEKKPENRFAGAKEFQQALVAAFPGYRDTDLGNLSQAAHARYATREEATIYAREQGPAMTAAQTGMQAAGNAPATMVQQFEQKFLLNKKLPYILAAIGLLVLLAIVIAIKLPSNKGGDIALKIPVPDTFKKNDVNQQQGNQPVITPVLTAQPVQVPVHADPLPAETVLPEKNKTEKKKAEKKEEQKKPVPVPPVAQEVKPLPVPAAEKTPERKEVYINDKLELSVSMRETITRNEDDRDQSVTFTVTSPVVYQGITIIKRGAIARGNIKIGRILSTVDIISVMAANGQEIVLKGRDHRKVRDLAADREYRAILQKGTRMSF